MPKLKKLLQEIELARKQHHLFKRNDSLVAAVSGGPDSIALLELLSKLRHKYKLRIVVAHLNHGLSKKAGKRYLLVTEKISKRLGCPFYSRRVDLRGLAKKYKRSLEEMGRIERYRFFEEVAKKTKCRKIATAHTLDDQAETVLMRLFRGAGLRGLAGIPYQRAHGGKLEIIRPLLSSEKKDLISFLKESRIPFCVDPTNRHARFTRNRVRHELLPKITALFNPQIKQSLASLQTICHDAQDYLEKASSQALANCLQNTGSARKKISLKISGLKKLHPAILREVLTAALLKKRGDLKRLGYSHIAAITDILNAEENNLETHLPGPITVRKTRHLLEIL